MYAVNLFFIDDINFKSFVNYFVFLPIFLILNGVNGLYPGIMIPHAEEVKKCTTSTFFTFLIITLVILYSNMTESNYAKLITKESDEIKILLAFIVAFICSLPLYPGIRALSKHFFAKFS